MQVKPKCKFCDHKVEHKTGICQACRKRLKMKNDYISNRGLKKVKSA